MSPETRQEIVLAAVRWASNILVEVLANHARAVSGPGADKLRQVTSLLDDAARDFRVSYAERLRQDPKDPNPTHRCS